MWYFQGKPYKEIHDPKLYGFVYKITYKDPTTGKELLYLGRKAFYSTRTVKMGKREIAAMKDKRRKKTKKVTKESTWKSYKSSNEFLKKQPESCLKKEILCFAKDTKQLTYLENKYLYCEGVLESPVYLNGNISGKIFNQY